MGSSTEYVFTRDYLDNNRINLQHYIWTDAFGYNLHPRIPISQSHLRVADIGTGTGTVSRQLPKTAQLDGLDVSLDAAPPAEWLPENVRLRQWNVFDDVPDELRGVYDIVHVRHLVFVLSADHVPQVLTKILRLLKPGGYIQWGEMDISSFRTEKTKPDNGASALIELLQSQQSSDARLLPRWVPSLSQLFASKNLDDIATDVRDMPPDIGFRWHECGLMAPELQARKSQDPARLEKVRNLMPEVQRQTAAGVRWAFTSYTVIGQKPFRKLERETFHTENV